MSRFVPVLWFSFSPLSHEREACLNMWIACCFWGSTVFPDMSRMGFTLSLSTAEFTFTRTSFVFFPSEVTRTNLMQFVLFVRRCQISQLSWSPIALVLQAIICHCSYDSTVSVKLLLRTSVCPSVCPFLSSQIQSDSLSNVVLFTASPISRFSLIAIWLKCRFMS